MLTLNQHPTMTYHHHPKPTKKLFYQSPHILMIEDSPLVQYAQTQMLERLGCRVTVVDHGALGIAFAQNKVVDAIIADLELPDMHGTEVARAIRHNDPLIPIIVCSTNALDLALHPDVDQALEKPMHVDTVFAVLSRLLGERFLFPLH